MAKKIVISEKPSAAKDGPAHPPASRRSGSSQPNQGQGEPFAVAAFVIAAVAILVAVIAAAVAGS
jgi:hypothetical protein